MDGGRPGTLNAENQMGCITFTESGSNPWDVILGQSNLGLVRGKPTNSISLPWPRVTSTSRP